MGSRCCSGGADPSAFPRAEGRKVESRAFTDRWCAVVAIGVLAGMILCVLSGFWYGGEPARLTHGADWSGRICGVDRDVKAEKFMVFCGSPERTGGGFPKYIIEGSTVCVSTCPTDASVQLPCLMPAVHNFTDFKGGMIGTIPNVNTLEMVLTQSVTFQASYPTEEWGGRFCLPADTGLRDMLIDGPWGQYYRPLVAVGGLIKSWPLLAISAGVSMLFGFLYLYCMMRCAGPLFFFTMVMSTLFTLAAGLFFLCAIFMDMDADTVYTRFNPITSMYIGDQAKIFSIVSGVILTLLAAFMGCFTAVSMRHIDECVGLIDAACEPFRKNGSWPLWLFPAVGGSAFLSLIVFFTLFGLPIVASLGKLDNTNIRINGKDIQGLQQYWKKDGIQRFEFWFYLVGMFLMLEFYLQLGHYIVSYMISCWYFTHVTERRNEQPRVIEKALGAGIGKKVEVRVAGIDTNYGSRKGTVVGEGGQKMLVVPVGRKAPGLDRHEIELYEIVKDNAPTLSSLLAGLITGLTKHLGSIALGTPIILVLRPFRMVASLVTAFLARISGEDGDRKREDPHMTSIKNCFSLLSTCLEQVFGKYSKAAFTHLVLEGGGEWGDQGFLECCETAFQRLVKSGGSIAHLHGAMLLYDLFGSLCITLFCGWTVLILQDKLDMFNELSSPYYINDKNVTAIASMLVAFSMAFAWMSVWSQTADVLLYCVSWNRLQVHEAEERNIPEEYALKEVTDYCPQTMRYLLPDHELEAHQEHGLHAHGLGQQGAILAAMEHGAMGGDGSAPDYGQTLAKTHVMATKIMGA